MRQDRHRCAHPSFQRSGVPYNPPAEQARLHLRNVIVHVLSQPPVQGKAAIAELKTMVVSSYFPLDDHRALLQLRSSTLSSATEPLVRGFVDTLIFGFLTNSDVLFRKKQVVSAINSALVMYPEIVERRLRKQLNKAIRDVSDSAFDDAVYLVVNTENAWALLEQASRDKVKAFVETGPNNLVLPALKELAKFDELNDVVAARILALGLEDLADAIEPFNIGVLGKERALQLLQEVRSWDRANSVLSRVILPLFEFFDRNDIERVVRMPTEHGADLHGANAYRIFVEKVRESQLIPNTELNQLLLDNHGSYLVPQSLHGA